VSLQYPWGRPLAFVAPERSALGTLFPDLGQTGRAGRPSGGLGLEGSPRPHRAGRHRLGLASGRRLVRAGHGTGSTERSRKLTSAALSCERTDRRRRPCWAFDRHILRSGSGGAGCCDAAAQFAFWFRVTKVSRGSFQQRVKSPCLTRAGRPFIQPVADGAPGCIDRIARSHRCRRADPAFSSAQDP